MRIIGLDIHRAFAEAVAWENGKLKRLGRVDMRRDRLAAFASSLSSNDVVVVEATGNAAAVAEVIGPYVKRVVIANPKQVRIIAHARIKTDTIDAGVLAQLYASDFLPEVWIADQPTQALRRQVTRRNQIVRQRIVRVEVPALLLWGTRDAFLGRELVQPTLDLCNDARVVFLALARA